MEHYLGMSAAQMGYASRMRSRLHGSDRKVMNKIIHSEDVDQGGYGPNPFENNDEWDEAAQEKLKAIARKHEFADVLYGLQVTEFSHRVKELMKELGKSPPDEERERMLREIDGVLHEFCAAKRGGVGTTCRKKRGRVSASGSESAAETNNTPVSALHQFCAELLRRIMRAMD